MWHLRGIFVSGTYLAVMCKVAVQLYFDRHGQMLGITYHVGDVCISQYASH